MGSTSEVDQKEAYEIGKYAVKQSVNFRLSFSAGMNERKILSKIYKITFKMNSLEDVAGKTKRMPKQFYNSEQSSVTKEFINYALPLIGKNNKDEIYYLKFSILKITVFLTTNLNESIFFKAFLIFFSKQLCVVITIVTL